MSLTKKLMPGFLAGVALLLLLVFFLPAPLIQWAIERYGSQWLGAKVAVETVDFSWWPTRLSLKGVDVANPLQPMHNAVSFARLETTLDIPASLAGTLHISSLIIDGIVIGKPRLSSGALPGVPPRIPFVTPEGQAFKLPEVKLPPLDGIADKEKQLYSDRAKAFRQALKDKQAQWEARIAALPNKDTLATYRQRWDDIRAAKDPASRLLALGKLKSLQQDLKGDLEKFRQTDQEIKREWQELQNQYAQLKNLSAESLLSLMDQWGLSDSVISVLGQSLVQDTVNEWLNASLGYHRLLSAQGSAETDETAPARTQALLVIKKTVLSGPLVHGTREGEIQGEILNLSDAPHLIAEPVTLHIDAKGTRLGAMQLSGLLDHRIPGKESDRFNFSLKKSQLQDYLLAGHPDLQVMLRKAAVSIDMAGSIEQMRTLDLSMNTAFKSLALEVTGEKADNEIVVALADALQQVPSISITALAQGDLGKPGLRITNTLDDVVAMAMRKVLGNKMAEVRQTLQRRLDEELQKQLASLEDDLARNNAMLDLAKLRGTDFNTLLDTVKPTLSNPEGLGSH